MELTDITDQLLSEVRRLQTTRPRLLVAIDGRCASGKTSLAALLQDQLGCAVISMDHFFLRPEQRRAERLSTPGGNVDYERFGGEVLGPLVAGVDFCYRPYDCQRGELLSPVWVPRSAVTVIEGSYCCHPVLRDAYDVRAFLTVSPGEQLARITARNGRDAVKAFQERWIPLEETYFTACAVAEACHLFYDTSETLS
jgi:uridine kinase